MKKENISDTCTCHIEIVIKFASTIITSILTKMCRNITEECDNQTHAVAGIVVREL